MRTSHEYEKTMTYRKTSLFVHKYKNLEFGRKIEIAEVSWSQADGSNYLKMLFQIMKTILNYRK